MLASLLFACAACQKPSDDGAKTYFKALKTTDIEVGSGPVAAKDDLVLVEYTGTFPGSDKPFDTNVSPDKSKDPLAFVIGQAGVVKGMEDGVVGMKPGGRRRIEIPYMLAYGPDGMPPNIGRKQDLVFDVKLLHVVKKGEENLFDYEDLKTGTGRKVAKGDTVEVHYTAHYVNGKLVDDTRKRGKTVTFLVGDQRVISGVDRGVEGMSVGGRRRLVLPPETAWGPYGNTKTISGNQVLVIELDLLAIR